MRDQKERRILHLHCATSLITNKQDIFIDFLRVSSGVAVICDVLYPGDLARGCGQQGTSSGYQGVKGAESLEGPLRHARRGSCD